MQSVVDDAPAYRRHGVSLSEALAALTGLGVGEEVSEEEVLGALAASKHITNTPSLLSQLLDELPDVCASVVLPLLDATSRAMLARVNRACRTAVVSSGLTHAGASEDSPLELQNFGQSVERLAWAAANGCPWVVRKSTTLWLEALATFDGGKMGESEMLKAVWTDSKHDDERGTALWFAMRDYIKEAKMEDLKLAKHLVHLGMLTFDTADYEGCGHKFTPLGLATHSLCCDNDNGRLIFELATLLVQKGADVDDSSRDEVGRKVQVTNELATLLVQKGVDVDDSSRDELARKVQDSNAITPLCWAARSVYLAKKIGGLEVATLLVLMGANVNVVLSTFMIISDNNGNPSTFDFYLSTPLWWASRAVCDGRAGGLELATLLVQKGADVNAVGKDEGGKEATPLLWAAQAVCGGKKDGLALLTLLIQHGADVMLTVHKRELQSATRSHTAM